MGDVKGSQDIQGRYILCNPKCCHPRVRGTKSTGNLTLLNYGPNIHVNKICAQHVTSCGDQQDKSTTQSCQPILCASPGWPMMYTKSVDIILVHRFCVHPGTGMHTESVDRPTHLLTKTRVHTLQVDPRHCTDFLLQWLIYHLGPRPHRKIVPDNIIFTWFQQPLKSYYWAKPYVILMSQVLLSLIIFSILNMTYLPMKTASRRIYLKLMRAPTITDDVTGSCCPQRPVTSPAPVHAVLRPHFVNNVENRHLNTFIRMYGHK